MKRGTIVSLGNRSVFKLGVVIGASRKPGKVRVRVWSYSARSWSNPKAERVDSMTDVSKLSNLTPWQRTTLAAAERARHEAFADVTSRRSAP